MSALPGEPDFLRRYPSQLSVGQAQRVLIAMAVLHRPALLIADEPTSALDLITQAEILQFFASLSAKFGISILYISHDLLSVATIAHRVAVMHQGEIVECRRTAELFQSSRTSLHPPIDSSASRRTAACGRQRRRAVSYEFCVHSRRRTRVPAYTRVSCPRLLLERPGTPLVGCPRARCASCAFCLLSVFRAACVCA